MNKLVAIGDSVAWGQGNLRKRKFAARACEGLGLDPRPIIVAHSGACIDPKHRVKAPYGEVPLDSPGIREQIPRAKKLVGDVESVDVVLLNGGINDVPVSNIISDPHGKLAKHAHDAFNDFPLLLAEVLDAFPKATIVALGYYPIVSDKTPVDLQVKTLLHLGPPETAALVAAALEAKEGDALRAAPSLENELRGLTERCALFVEISKRRIEDAVAGSHGRAVFAVPDWCPEYSLGFSKETRLWRGTNDSVFGKRLLRYLAHLAMGHFDWPPQTILASLGHPNIAGSDDYANAIVKAVHSLR